MITLLSGTSYTLPACKTVLDIRVQACAHFPDALPPEIYVIDPKGKPVQESSSVPTSASVVFREGDRSSEIFWESAFEDFAKFGNSEKAASCVAEIRERDPAFVSEKFLRSVEIGELDIASALIASARNVDELGNGALIHSVNFGREDIVEALIAFGADVGYQEDDGDNALAVSIQCEHLGIARAIIAAGANVDAVGNNSGMSLLADAARLGFTAGVSLLLENKADVHLLDNYGTSALMVGAKCGRIDVVEILCEHRGNVNDTDSNGSTALSLAATNAGVDMMSLLIERGASLDVVDSDGDGLVENALYGGGLENAEYLLRLGLPLGRKSLFIAMDSGESEVVEYVLSKDRTLLNERDNGETAREYAVERSLFDIVDILDAAGQVNGEEMA